MKSTNKLSLIKVTSLFTVLSLLLVLMITPMLSSCEKAERASAITFTRDDGSVYATLDEGAFSYFASQQKTMYLYSLLGQSNFASYATQYDTPEFWGHVDTGAETTLGDYVYEKAIIEEAKGLLISAYLFDEVYKLEMPAEVGTNIDSLMASLEKAKGSKSAFEDYLLGYGTNPESVRYLEELQYKKTLLEKFLYGDGGIVPVSDDDIKLYFEQNYAIVKQILINDSYVAKDDGTQRDLTAEELAEKEALIESVNARISAGEDFDALVEEYKDGDKYGFEQFPNGYFVTNDNIFLPEFQNAALEMKDGEVRTVKSSYGTHILKKYAMDSSLFNAYESIYTSIKTVIETKLFGGIISEYNKNISQNDEVISAYNITIIPLMN